MHTLGSTSMADAAEAVTSTETESKLPLAGHTEPLQSCPLATPPRGPGGEAVTGEASAAAEEDWQDAPWQKLSTNSLTKSRETSPVDEE